MHHTRRASGFTLIELSIVLVIIALIVAGVLVGKDLIRTSELRSLLSTTTQLVTAVNTFKGKYSCLPGDCINATTFFGAATGCPGGPTATGTQTCNGDGNSQITIFAPVAGDGDYEQLRVFQHLANAGLIPGTYGTGSNVGGYTGLNFYPAPFNKQLAATIYWKGYITNVADNWFYTGDYGHVIMWGGTGSGATHRTSQFGYLSPIDTMSLDGKIDDGLPGTGKFYGMAPNAGLSMDNNCTTSSDFNTARYNTAYEGKDACIPLFSKIF